MSTHWGYHCATCNVSTGHWWNHGDDQLGLIARHWPEIKPAYTLMRDGDIWRIQLQVSNWYDPPYPLDFLAEHDGHQIVLENEYGERRSL